MWTCELLFMHSLRKMQVVSVRLSLEFEQVSDQHTDCFLSTNYLSKLCFRLRLFKSYFLKVFVQSHKDIKGGGIGAAGAAMAAPLFSPNMGHAL